jgi:hypothetical protein
VGNQKTDLPSKGCSASLHKMSTWIQTAATKSIQRNGLKVAIIVGTLLNLINQGDVILNGAWSEIQVPKLLLTFCVPYCVAVYAGTQAMRDKA